MIVGCNEMRTYDMSILWPLPKWQLKILAELTSSFFTLYWSKGQTGDIYRYLNISSAQLYFYFVCIHILEDKITF